uniref:Uncharacterized protein n=1 Tax=Opuntia streptacantha TaxID=393608 RepID=A0A7C8Z3D7_OPUST
MIILMEVKRDMLNRLHMLLRLEHCLHPAQHPGSQHQPKPLLQHLQRQLLFLIYWATYWTMQILWSQWISLHQLAHLCQCYCLHLKVKVYKSALNLYGGMDKYSTACFLRITHHPFLMDS